MNRRDLLRALTATSLATPLAAWAAERPQGLEGDVALLRQAYETLHPGLNRYLAPHEAARGFDALAAAWRRGPALGEAYLALAGFLATLRCGHSYANFYNQSPRVRDALFAGSDKLPFHFRWLERRMVVTDPCGTGGLAAGDVVLAIDGEPAPAVLARLLRYARADGGNDAKRVAQLQVRGQDDFEAFDIYFALTRARPEPAFVLELAGPAGPRRLEVPAISLAGRRAQRRGVVERDGPAFTARDVGDGVVLLTMPGWALYNSRWDWRGFLDELFADLARRGAATLVVDLRGNEGGLDVGDEIVARCIDRPLPRTAYERRVRYRRTPAELNAVLDTWDDSFRDWGEAAVPLGDGWFRLLEREGASRAPIEPRGPRFRGRLVVLTDADNSSATFAFAELVKRERLGLLVGATTGGNRRGINGGAFFFLRLPASGIEVDVPLIGSFPLTPQPDAGIEPDVAVADTIADLAAGRDAVLERALVEARA